MFPFIVSTNNYKTLFYKRRSLIYKVRLNNKYVQTYPMPFRKENNMLLIFFMRILFQKKHIPTKTRPIQMNVDLEHHCRLEIQDLESKSLIQKSKSPWSCAHIYIHTRNINCILL
jgi:hypothetical protein